MKKTTHKVNKNIITRDVVIVIVIAIVMYLIYTIVGIINVPTNIVVVEEGKLTMEEETVRLCCKRRSCTPR